MLHCNLNESKKMGPISTSNHSYDQIEIGPQEEAWNGSKVSTNNRKWLFAILAVAVTGLAAFAIAFPIVHNNNNADSISKEKTSMVANFQGPFNVSLNLLNADIVEGYSSIYEFQVDMQNVANFLLNNVVKRNLGVNGYKNAGMGYGNMQNQVLDTGMPAPNTAGAAGDIPPSNKNVDDYGTNNQESAVDEGDVVKSDGNKTYAAYGDYIIIWKSRTGERVLDFKLPAINITRTGGTGTSGSGTSGGATGVSTTATSETVTGTVTNDGSDIAQKDAPVQGEIVAPYYIKPNIRDLLVVGKRLIVLAEGYGYAIRESLQEQPILNEFMSTKLFIYDTTTLDDDKPTLTLVSEKNITGSVVAIRAVGKSVHLVTLSSMNLYPYLIAPFERYNFPGDISDEAYLSAVQNKSQVNVQNFVKKLSDEIISDDGQLPFITRITLWQSVSSETSLEELAYSNGVANAMVFVTSFDAASDPSTLTFSSTISAIPSSWAQVYASTDSLIIAGQGWDYNSELQRSEETTYLIQMLINGTAALPYSIGKVRGYVMNSYSLDAAGSILRVATSIRNVWSMAVGVPIGDGQANATFISPVEESLTENYVITLLMPGPDNESNSGLMAQLGQISLGKPNEVFTTVRFFDDLGYAVTFERKDPFYVLNLTDPRNITILGEIDNLSGFSSYLHPMNDDNTLLLAIGQETDKSGVVTGLSMSVFDMSDLSNPQLKARNVLNQDPSMYSSSDALWDFHSIRYNREIERVIIPVQMMNWANYSQSFQGFIIFFVNATTVEEECRIDHVSGEVNIDVCYYCASIPPRSMIFDGDLTTIRGHFVRSTDMKTCQYGTGFDSPSYDWSFDIIIDDPTGGCCNIYYS